MRRRLIHTIFRLGFIFVILSARCGLEAWIPLSCVAVIVIGKSVEELYPLTVRTLANWQLPIRRRIAWTIPILPMK